MVWIESNSFTTDYPKSGDNIFFLLLGNIKNQLSPDFLVGEWWSVMVVVSDEGVSSIRQYIDTVGGWVTTYWCG